MVRVHAGDSNAHRVAYDAVDAPTVLVAYAPELRAIESNWPKIRFHALREHAGLVFQRQLGGLGQPARCARRHWPIRPIASVSVARHDARLPVADTRRRR